MRSLILATTSRVLRPLLFLFSLVVLFRGHQEPGGGFAGGLLAASAFSIRPIRHEAESGQRELRIHPHTLIGSGLLLALGTGIAPLFAGLPFLTGLWAPVINTVLLFDIGVYLAVMGVVVLMVRTLAEE